MVIVVLGGGVVVVMVVMVTLDVSIGKKEGRRGRWWLLGRCHPCCQRCITLDGAIPTRCSWLGCGGQKTGPISPVIDASGQVVIAVVPPGIVKEISPGAETMAVDHASWSQVLVGSLDSKENHN